MREITNNTDCERSVMHHSERDREINQTNITHSERENISLRHSESVGASEEKITQANEGEANLDCERSSEKHPKEVQSDIRHNVQREQRAVGNGHDPTIVDHRDRGHSEVNGCVQSGASEKDTRDCERSIRKPTLQPSAYEYEQVTSQQSVCVSESEKKKTIGDCERSISNPLPH